MFGAADIKGGVMSDDFAGMPAFLALTRLVPSTVHKYDGTEGSTHSRPIALAARRSSGHVDRGRRELSAFQRRCCDHPATEPALTWIQIEGEDR